MVRELMTILSFGFLICVWLAATAHCDSKVLCKCKKSICEERCNILEGARGLNCFGRRSRKSIVYYYCTWNLGRYTEYDLFIKQRSCKSNPRVYSQNMTSDAFSLADSNMTAYAIALSDKKKCIFAEFSGSPGKMVHCGPPNIKSFNRSSGHLWVTAEWNDFNVKNYNVEYRRYNTSLWKMVQSQDSRNCIVGNLSSSLSYEIRIQCVETPKCPQCPWSEINIIPQDLTEAPVIKETHFHLMKTGQRRVVLKWEFIHSERVENYSVTVQKASSEPAVQSNYVFKAPTVILILCYSAYQISIKALNNASQSPAAYRVIEAMEDGREWNKALNVSVYSNNSFNISWSLKQVNCYCVEWWVRGEKPAYETFYVKKNHYDVQTKNILFKPYKRYHFLLHVRKEKDSCHLKKVNDSEHTYGGTEAYLTEGKPLAAPGNVTASKVTQSSCVVSWTPVAEEDLQGFLRGYIICYIDRLDSSEKNITVGPGINSFKLLNLKSRTVYGVQLSAFTSAGEGPRSDIMKFKTFMATGGMLAGLLVGIIGLLLISQLCFQLLQRSKNLLWPNIPNPYNSNAVRKIEGNQKLVMANLDKTEERVCVLEVKNKMYTLFSQDERCIKDELVPVIVTESTSALSHQSQSLNTSTKTNSTSAEALCIDFNQKDSPVVLPTDNETTEDNFLPESSNAAATECVCTTVTHTPVAFVSDYTTMELFQQITRTKLQTPSNQQSPSETVPLNPGHDYIHHGLPIRSHIPSIGHTTGATNDTHTS